MLNRLKKLPRLVQILIAFFVVIASTAFLGALMRPAPVEQVVDENVMLENESNLDGGGEAEPVAPPRPGPKSAVIEAEEVAPVVSSGRQERRRPAAFPSDHPVRPGALDTYYTSPSNRGWVRIGEKSVDSGMPLVALDTQAVGDAGIRGWNSSTARRISRSGLFHVEEEGEHAFILDGAVPGWQSGMAHRQVCQVAVGDEGSVVLKGQEGAAGTTVLDSGWHWIFFQCEPTPQWELAADVAVVGPSAGSADLIALYLPEDREGVESSEGAEAGEQEATATVEGGS